MKKDLKNIVFGVIIALCLFVLAMQWLSLIFNFVGAPDLIELNNSGEGAYVKTIRFMQWTSISMFCLLVPTLLCFTLSAFTESKILNIMAIVLGAAVAICCIVFMIIPADYYYYGKNKIIDAVTMTAVTGIWEMFTSILIPSVILTGFAVARLVKGGKA